TRMTTRNLLIVILVVVLLAGVARVALALHNHRALYDEVLVMEMADQLVKGQGYTLEFAWWPALAPDGWPQPDAQHRPLLPTLVAGAWLALGPSVPVAAAVVAAIAGLCVLVTFLWGWRAGGVMAGAVAVAVMLVNAHYWKETIFSLTSPVYGLFLALAVWAFGKALAARRWRWAGLWAAVGLLAGLGWLTRPEGPLILPALALSAGVVWWRRRPAGPGARGLVVGLVLASVVFLAVASPLIAYNLSNFGTVFHATGAVTQWAPNYEARFSVTPPTAQAYWATHTPGDYATSVGENLVWMLALLSEYLTWPVLALLVAAAGLAVWRASPLTAVVVYTLVFMLASLFQSPMSIWPGTQYFMYYSSILPLWAVLIGWAAWEVGPALWATPLRRRATVVALMIGLAPVLVVEGAQVIDLVGQVSRSQTEVADPRLYDFAWMAAHTDPQAIVMTWDVENLHWYSDHRRAVMIPSDDARTIQAFMRRFAVTHFYHNDWLVLKRPALKPLRKALRQQADLGPYSVLQPVHVGEGILFQVEWAGPPAVLLVDPAPATEEAIAQAWLRYAVTHTLPADISAYPAVIASDKTPDLSSHYQPVNARLGDAVELLGYAQRSVDQSGSQILQIALYWRCLAPVEKDYTVFNHLLDGDGAWVASQDDPPANGFYPTSWWQPGDVIVDQHTLVVPADTPPGAYQLAVGLYDPATMQRLPVTGGGDAVVLTPIAIGGRP
ncbi:MAG: glycosyltransferase family 39 protein, partial [Chloroflexi bacterium]|nr:glycosyltransferase family 39 protein [Chloroflexota bacterium]